MRRDLSLFYRQLAMSVRAGIPITQGLSLAAAACQEPRLVGAVAEISRRVRGGGPLAPAFGAHPEVFGEVDVALVAVGEENGLLDANLDRLAQRSETQYHAGRRFFMALAYPALLLVAAILLPPLFILVTRSPGEYFRAVGGRALPFALFLGALAAAVLFLRRSSPSLFDRLLLELPVLGPNLRKLALARFGESLAALYSAGVEVKKALRLAIRAIGNRHLQERCREIPGLVERGGTLADALASTGVFPRQMVAAVAVGEKSGELDTALEAFSRLSQEEADRALKALMIAIPIAIYLLVALYVAWIVISAFGSYFRTLGSF
jgi:type IV pilus assembly protein PilC